MEPPVPPVKGLSQAFSPLVQTALPKLQQRTHPTDAVQTGAFLALRYSSVCPFYCAITESIKHPFETPWTSADTQTVVKLTFFAVSVITAVKPSEKQHIKTRAPQSQGGKANVELRFCSSYRSPGDHTGPGIPADKTCSKPAKQAMGNAALPKSTRAPPSSSSSSSISLHCHFPGERRESPLIQITWPTRGSSDLGMKLSEKQKPSVLLLVCAHECGARCGLYVEVGRWG